MLWRLNFLSIMCCLTMGNPYILYYICPLHTFFFLLVYITMNCYSKLNHTRYYIHFKFACLGLLLFITYDMDTWYCGFQFMMASFLSTLPTMGAAHGVQW